LDFNRRRETVFAPSIKIRAFKQRHSYVKELITKNNKISIHCIIVVLKYTYTLTSMPQKNKITKRNQEETMGFLKDASESILKYSGILINKTEEYTRIAKLNLEIKKLEGDIDKLQAEVGRVIEDMANTGAASADMNDSKIAKLLESIKELRSTIGSKKKNIEELKEEAEKKTAESTEATSEPKDDAGSNV